MHRSRALAVARGAALFVAVAAVTALVLWSQTRSVRRAPRTTPAPSVVTPHEPAPAPRAVVTEEVAPPTVTAPGAPVPPAQAPGPAALDRNVYFSTSKAMMAPELELPEPPVLVPPPPDDAGPRRDRVFFSTSKAMMAPELDLEATQGLEP